MPEILPIITRLSFLLLWIISVWNYLKFRDTVHRQIAFMFSSIAIALFTSIILDLDIVENTVPFLVGAFALIIQPYLTLYLTKYFHKVPIYIEYIAILGIICSTGILLISTIQATSTFYVFIVAYIVIVNAYTIMIFIRGAITARGFVQKRLKLIVLGLGLFVLAIFWNWLALILSSFSNTLDIVVQFSAIGSASCFYAGLASPTWLRRKWHLDELYDFIVNINQISERHDIEQVYEIMCRSTLLISGGQQVSIAYKTEQGDWMRYELANGTQLLDEGTSLIFDDFRQKLIPSAIATTTLTKDVQIALQINTEELIYIVPILYGGSFQALILVTLEFGSLFPKDDLQMIMLFAEQMVVVLQNLRHIQQLNQRTSILEQRIEQGASHFRAIANLAPIPLVITSLPDGEILYANQASVDIHGIRLEDLVGKTAPNFYANPQDRQIIIEKIATQGYVLDHELQLKRIKDDSLLWVTINIQRLRFEGKDALFSTFNDITERKDSLEAERTRRLFSEALHDTVTGILTNELDLNAILKRILLYAGELTPCDTASIMIVDDSIAQVVHTYQYDETLLPHISKIRFEVSQTPNLQAMVQSGKPLFIPNIKTFEGWRKDVKPALNKIKSYIGAPIFVGEELFGFINLDANEVNRFTPDHAEQLALLSGQAAIAIQNAQLYEQNTRYTKRLELLLEIDHAILRNDAPRAIAQAVLPRLKNLLTYHSASIALFDIDYGTYSILATTSTLPGGLHEGAQYKLEKIELLARLMKNELIIVDDILERDYLTRTERMHLAVGIRSYARIPLFARGRLLGTLNFRALEPQAFTYEQLSVVQEVSAQLAIAIENARLLEIEQRRNSELTALHQASIKLTRTFDINMVFNTVIEYSILLMNANHAHIFLYENDKLTFGAAYWNKQQQQQPISEPRSNGVTYRVAQTGERVVISDVQSHPMFKDTSYTGAVIALPLRIADTVAGVMRLVFDNPHYFTEQELYLLELLADQATIALHNAQLYNQIQVQNEELEQRVYTRTKELSQARDRVEAILDNTSDAILLADKNGIIYQTNPGFIAEIDTLTGNLVNQHLSTIVTAEYRDKVNQIIDEAIELKSAKRLEVNVLRNNTTPLPMDALFASFDDGENIGIVCSLRDVSLQKAVETELRNALERERELNELKTNFTSIVSHEFRTPLAVILSSSQILERYSDRLPAHRKQEKFAKITKQVHRLTQLIEDVLLKTRSETVGLEYNPQNINAVALCKDILDDVQVGYFSRNINIEFDSTGIPNSLALDEFLFTHILQNLASNAIKYSNEHGTIYVNLTIDDELLILHIKDEGIGIPQEHQSKLFESFQRASNVGNIEGTGMGLVIVKRAVDAHKGTIIFESQEGVGTTFIVKLPIEPHLHI